jgi:hypothetical protein
MVGLTADRLRTTFTATGIAMASPTPLPRLEEIDSQTQGNATSAPTQAEIDAAHGTTGWSAYDVWRNRVFREAKDADQSPKRK